MKIKEIYKLAIDMGISNDPRGRERVKKYLLNEKAQAEKLSDLDQKFYDRERFHNPYSDTRILNMGTDKEIKTILAGIDISCSELLLSDEIGKRGDKTDLVISHHPLGRALASLDDVVRLQADMFYDLGVPVNVAESLLEKRMSEISRKLSSGNHNRVVDFAKILQVNLLCTHTPCDNLVYQYLKKEIEKKNPDTVGELYDTIVSIPEYSQASDIGIGPKIFSGKRSRRCGKIAFTEVTGGTSTSKNIYEWLSRCGVGTIVGMHLDEENREEAEKHHISVLIAGHMSSDSLGMNLFLDKLASQGIKIIPCSGLIRVERYEKKRKK